MKKFTILSFLFSLLLISCGEQKQDIKAQAEDVLRELVLEKAAWALEQEPITVTASSCERSAGGLHDFYSEGDYWWPNPEDPDGPYIQRDGETNPENFVDHRLAMIRFSEVLGALGSAYVLTGEDKYVEAAMAHADAWFCNPETLMNPCLLYTQAIKGRHTGRGIGIIDTVHLMEVTQALKRMEGSEAVDQEVLAKTKEWFTKYCEWLTTHEYGVKEMNAKNNHGTCWVMQTATFASFTGDKELLKMCSDRYKNILLPTQLAKDGGFPLELARTKPYGYSIFNLDAMVAVCQILSTEDNDLWSVTTKDNVGIENAVAFLAPFIADKSTWTLPADVMYWDEWPVAQSSFLFAAIHYNNPEWFELWAKYDHNPKVAEVVRNMPIRNPLLWI